jgi:transcriptional regulator with XRE-family HTH domain
MSGIEPGAKLPSLPTLERIAGVLGVGWKDLFNFDHAGFRRIQPLSRKSLDLASVLERASMPQRRRILRVVKILGEQTIENALS